MGNYFVLCTYVFMWKTLVGITFGNYLNTFSSKESKLLFARQPTRTDPDSKAVDKKEKKRLHAKASYLSPPPSLNWTLYYNTKSILKASSFSDSSPSSIPFLRPSSCI